MSDDLARSGRFKTMDRKDMIEQPHTGAEHLASMIGAGSATTTSWSARCSRTAPDRYNITFELYNVLTRQRLLGYQISANKPGLRLASHQVADMVFEKILGIRGAFATRIAYISVLGTLPNKNLSAHRGGCGRRESRTWSCNRTNR